MGSSTSCISQLPPEPDHPAYLHQTKHPTDHSRFENVYQIDRQLGCGSYGTVYRCHRRRDNKAFAVKIFAKNTCSDEVHILQQLQHQHIVQLIDSFSDQHYIFMVLELCRSHTLFDLLCSAPLHQFDETLAAQIIYDIATALQHVHSHHIVHRDLKPENILFDMRGNIKLADFGLALQLQLQAKHREYPSSSCVSLASQSATSTMTRTPDPCCNTESIVGSLLYLAPEVIEQRDYGYHCDVWSLGVILFTMLAGYQPFGGGTPCAVYDSIQAAKSNGDYLKSARWQSISDHAQQLVDGMLTVDPAKRFTLDDIKQHPWIVKRVATAARR